jgi:uncharacterized damage-inducible protein DinB
MDGRSQLQLLAKYNRWMNGNLYACAARLSPEALFAERGAFFGSIFGTLNHLAAGDTIWLKRFAAHPGCAGALAPLAAAATPPALDAVLFPDLAGLRRYRDWLDGLIVDMADALPEEALAQPLTYANTKGVESTRNLMALLVHFFNHQTHHRGQVTTLLFQAGIDPGTTDLLALI